MAPRGAETVNPVVYSIKRDYCVVANWGRKNNHSGASAKDSTGRHAVLSSTLISHPTSGDLKDGGCAHLLDRGRDARDDLGELYREVEARLAELKNQDNDSDDPWPAPPTAATNSPAGPALLHSLIPRDRSLWNQVSLPRPRGDAPPIPVSSRPTAALCRRTK